jgi:hypothetical protein
MGYRGGCLVQNTARSSVWFPFYVRRSRRLGHVQSDSLDASPGSTSQDLTSFAAPSFPWGSAKGRYLPSALTTPGGILLPAAGAFNRDEAYDETEGSRFVFGNWRLQLGP